MAEIVRRTALDDLVKPLPPNPEAQLRLGEIPHTAKLNLRGDRADEGFRRAVAEIVGTEPPPGPEAWIGREGTAILGLGPDEWLVIGPEGTEAQLAERLEAALAGRFAAVTDVTENWTVIAASGAKLREVLAKGCPLDLHPRTVRPGFVGQSMVVHADVILHLMADGSDGQVPAAHLYVRRSFAPYLRDWLADAALEFGVGEAV
jgi:sarcosine oxidase subunit gamma